MTQQTFAAPSIIIPGQKITWAGEGLLPDRFLFGTDNGVVLECGINGSLENMHFIRVTEEEEAINGVSFYYNDNSLHLAATTRTDIILNGFIAYPMQKRAWHAGYGAHGVKRTLDNYFVAPAGPSGVVVLMLEPDGKNRVQSPPAIAELRNFYDFAMLGLDQHTGPEVCVFACRSDGLAFFLVGPGKGLLPGKISKVGEKIVDFVGVLSIRSSEFPLAMVGLGKNRSIHFFRDPLHVRAIDSLELPDVQGTAYKLLRYGNHLILLTSKGLCLLPEIIGQFHRGEYIGGERRVRYIEIEVIDMNIAFENWLLLVTTDGVVKMDLTALLPSVEIPEAIKRRISNDPAALWKDDAHRVEVETPMLTDTTLNSDMWADVEVEEAVMQTVG
jgi:hypothetical protein